MTRILVLLSTLCYVIFSTTTSYSGYRLVAFEANKETAKWLEDLEEHGYDFDERTETRRVLVDVFSEPSKQRKDAVVLVAPEFFPTFVDLLKLRGVDTFRVVKEDVQKELDAGPPVNRDKLRFRRHLNQASDFNLEDYHGYDAMVDYMRQITNENPQHTQLLEVGSSFEGRTLYGVKIYRRGAVKPAVFIDAGIHAREWIAPASALYMINELITRYGRDDRITRAVDKFDWFIVPQSNPDGYEYSMSVDRLWRKTRSKNTTVNKWCVGADANRNWGFRWGEAGANRSPCSNIYAGAHPFSEPEIRGIKEFITWNIPQLTIYASLHSYGQVLLSPWGYTNQKPENYIDQKNAAQYAVDAIRNSTGANYNHGTISELMYPASGTSIDFMQHRGVPYIYGVELRPTDSLNSFAFSLPPSYIKTTGEEMIAAFLALSDYATVQKKL